MTAPIPFPSKWACMECKGNKWFATGPNGEMEPCLTCRPHESRCTVCGGTRMLTYADASDPTGGSVVERECEWCQPDIPDDLGGYPDDYTTETVGTLLRHLDRCEGYLVMLERIARQIETCDAMRGMQNDIGPASYEVAQETAAAMRMPSLRERLGRAPLASEGVLP